MERGASRQYTENNWRRAKKQQRAAPRSDEKTGVTRVWKKERRRERERDRERERERERGRERER